MTTFGKIRKVFLKSAIVKADFIDMVLRSSRGCCLNSRVLFKIGERLAMKRWLVLLAAALFSGSMTGCIASPPLAADPSVRVYQLIQQSEQLRQTGYDMS